MSEPIDPKLMACLLVREKLEDYSIVKALPKAVHAMIVPACMAAMDETGPSVPHKPKHENARPHR